MPHANIWIRKENEEAWDNISDKSAWVNTRLSTEPQEAVALPKPIQEKEDGKKAVQGLICAHGAGPKMCRVAKCKNYQFGRGNV